MPPGSHRQLIVWQVSCRLAKLAIQACEHLPPQHQWGLGSQISRSAVSVPSNIAEGSAKGPGKEFLRGLRIARGSLAELETQILIAKELGYLKPGDDLLAIISRVERMLNSLISTIARKIQKEARSS
jgi:four helix bundle protein